MRISDQPIAREVTRDDWPALGIGDICWLSPMGRGWHADRPITAGMHAFLEVVSSMALPGEYVRGAAYCRVMDAGSVEAGIWHYDIDDPDTGTKGPDTTRAEARFTMAWSTHPYEIANAFTEDRSVWGSRPGGSQTWTQPLNGHVAWFRAGYDLHARLAAPERPGHLAVFASASLWRPSEIPAMTGRCNETVMAALGL